MVATLLMLDYNCSSHLLVTGRRLVAEKLHSFIGIDIGGTNLRGALISSGGEVLQRFRMLSMIHEGREPFLDRLQQGVSGLMATADAHGLSVGGVGVGVPGLIDRHGVVHSSVNMPALEGLGLREQLESQLKLPVRCANDANLIALGEARYGAGQGLDSMMVITIGTGLGSGLILNRRLWEGSNGFAAEFGHVTVEPEGFPCPCGNRGCLEQYVSATALRRLSGGLEAAELAQLAREGDHDAHQLFCQLGRHLGIAVAGLLNVLNLDGIVIGGGVSASFDLFQVPLVEELQRRTFAQILAGVGVRQAALGDDAGLLGAALLAGEA